MQFNALAISRAVDVLPTPAHAGHQKGVGQPVTRDGVGESSHHRLLPDQFGKGLRAIFARQHAIRLAGCGRSWCWVRRGNRQRRGIAEECILTRRLEFGSGRAGIFFRQFGIGIAHGTKLGARRPFVMVRLRANVVEKEPSDPPQFTWAASFRT